uniref:Uncharacterized protein n=1 Tax=Pseudomonas phage HRDY3 TaxID=3236930 RepID=A0AB39CEA0_9VIRU
MSHGFEVICDHTNNTQEDIDNNVLNLDIVGHLPLAGWKAAEEIVMPEMKPGWDIPHDRSWFTVEEADALKAKMMGLSPEFLSAGGMYVVVPSYAAALQRVNERLTKSLHRVRCDYLKPIAVRGGALLRHNKMKFRSLRVARLWWKTNMRDNPDFDPEQFMPKGQLGTMYGVTITNSRGTKNE